MRVIITPFARRGFVVHVPAHRTRPPSIHHFPEFHCASAFCLACGFSWTLTVTP